MSRATFLLPRRERFGGQRFSAPVARVLGRADRHELEPGERAQLRRCFSLVPDHWPLAALTRRVDAQDAETACWLRADPAHVRADINGARLLAYGDGLDLTREDTAAFLPALKPLFGDSGFTLDAPTPGHWYLRLPREAKLPVFAEPSTALGDDVFEHAPEGDAGRRWRSLLSEAQVVLHNHPRNAHRAASGRAPVNSLWFWGAGVLPDALSSAHARLQSDDEIARALAYGNCAVDALPHGFVRGEGDVATDLRHARDLAVLERDWLAPALRDIASGALRRLALDFDDGTVYAIEKRQRWRFWRAPVANLQGGPPAMDTPQ